MEVYELEKRSDDEGSRINAALHDTERLFLSISWIDSHSVIETTAVQRPCTFPNSDELGRQYLSRSSNVAAESVGGSSQKLQLQASERPHVGSSLIFTTSSHSDFAVSSGAFPARQGEEVYKRASSIILQYGNRDERFLHSSTDLLPSGSPIFFGGRGRVFQGGPLLTRSLIRPHSENLRQFSWKFGDIRILITLIQTTSQSFSGWQVWGCLLWERSSPSSEVSLAQEASAWFGLIHSDHKYHSLVPGRRWAFHSSHWLSLSWR